MAYLFFSSFWVTPGDAQGLFLALDSGITPGGARETMWGCQGSNLGQPSAKANAYPLCYHPSPYCLHFQQDPIFKNMQNKPLESEELGEIRIHAKIQLKIRMSKVIA